MITNKWQLFILICLLSISLNAQTTISGIVKDMETGEPLIGANILIKEKNIGTVTESDGSFRFTTSVPLPLNLNISYIGYVSEKVYVIDDSEQLKIYLQADDFTTEEVVVTASRWKEKIYDTPAAVSVLNSVILEQQALPNPMLVLKYTPGVQLLEQGTERVNIGLREGRLLFITPTQILLDNRTLSSPGLQFFDSSNSALNTLDLERVEVLRGSATAIYGAGAIAGIIHFQSKDPFKYPGTAVEVTGGERATFRTSVRHAWHSPNKKFGYKINATFRRSNDWELDPSDSTDAEVLKTFEDEIIDSRTGEVIYRTGGQLRKDNLGFGANTTIEFRPRYNLSLSASGGFSRFEGVIRQPLGEMLFQSNEYFGMIKAKYDKFFAQLSINHAGGFNNDNPTFGYRSGGLIPLGRTHWEGQIQYGLDLRSLYTNLIMGADFVNFKAETQGLSFGRYEDRDNYNYSGIYAQTRTALFDQVDWVFSGRLDYFQVIDKFAFSPRAALLYKINDRNTLRFSYTRASTPPSMFALYSDLRLADQGVFDVWFLGGLEAQTFPDVPTTSWFIPSLGETPGVGIPLQSAYSLVLGAINQTIGLSPEIYDYLQSETPNIEGFSEGLTEFPIADTEPLGLVTRRTFEIGFNGRISDKLKVIAELYFDKTSNAVSQSAQVSPLVYLPTLPEDLAAVVKNTLDPEALAEFGLIPEQVSSIFNLVSSLIARPEGELTPLGLIETEQMPPGGLPHLALSVRKVRGDIIRTGIDVGVQYSIMETLLLHGTYARQFNKTYRPPSDGIEDFVLDTFPNFPPNKFRLGLFYWQLPKSGFRANINVQYDSKWKVNDSIWSGDYPARMTVDVGVGYAWFKGVTIDFTATNVLNNRYSWPGLPKIGRQILGRVVYTFGNG